MKICGHAHSFTPQLDRGEIELPSIIRFYRELGLDAVEFPDRYVQEAGPAVVRAAVAESGMTVVCCDVAVDFVTTDPAKRREQVARKLEQPIHVLGARSAGCLRRGLVRQMHSVAFPPPR